jgi:hypothetical protein
MLIAFNSMALSSSGAMRLPPSLGYLAFRANRGLGAVAAPAQPQLTVQQLLTQIGQGSQISKYCSASSLSAKYCPGGCPTNQYALCCYWQASIAQRQLCWPPPSAWVQGASASVSKVANLGAMAVGTAGGLSTLGLIGGTAVLGPAALAAAPIAAIVGIFSANHAKAQAAQANAIAATVPAANAALQALDQALASGQITPAQASQALSQLQSQVSSAMKSGTSYKNGDALWCVDIAMQLVVAARNADLKAGVLSNGQPVPTTQASQSGASANSGAAANISTGLSSALLPIAALVAAGVFLFSKL